MAASLALGAGDPAGDAELEWWERRALAAVSVLDRVAPSWR